MPTRGNLKERSGKQWLDGLSCLDKGVLAQGGGGGILSTNMDRGQFLTQLPLESCCALRNIVASLNPPNRHSGNTSCQAISSYSSGAQYASALHKGRHSRQL